MAGARPSGLSSAKLHVQADSSSLKLGNGSLQDIHEGGGHEGMAQGSRTSALAGQGGLQELGRGEL